MLRTGGPFEMKVAQIMHKRQMSIQQAHYYVDPDLEKARETDVVAFGSFSFDTMAVLELAVVIECKYATKPFVLYRDPGHGFGDNPYFNRIATPLGSRWLAQAPTKPALQILPLFRHEDRVGYALATASPVSGTSPGSRDRNRDRDMTADPGADPAYKAMWGVTKATLALSKQLVEEDDSFRRISVLFPVIAIRGQLFEAKLEAEEITVQEIQRGQVNWSHPASPTGRVLIDVVTEEALDAFADDVQAASEAMRRDGLDAARYVISAYEEEQTPIVGWYGRG